MKNLILALAILAVGAGILLECRYAVIVDSPVVAKLDRLTGEVWIANSGMWRRVQCDPQDILCPKKAVEKPAAGADQ